MIILTYNILNPIHAVFFKQRQGVEFDKSGKVVDNWENRKGHITQNLLSYDFHIACLQEVNAHTIKAVKHPYKIASYAEHKSSSIKNAFGSAVIYNPEKVELIKKGVIKTKDVNYRVAPFAIFKDEQGRKVAVLSAHLKGYDRDAKDLQEKLQIKYSGFQELREYEAEFSKLEADIYVIAGDFNEHHLEMEYPLSRQKLLMDKGYQFDGDLSLTEHDTNRKIDWIFVKSDLDLELVSYKNQEPYPEASDHLPYATKLKL